MCTTPPPEVVFDRYFYNRIPRERREYRGKADLDRLRNSAIPAHLLDDLQRIINQALQNARPDPLHAAHGALHFDYVDSDVSNALAFSQDGYAFIGATIELLNVLWQSSHRLSTSPEVAAVLGVPDATNRELLQAQLFRLQLFFIVGHEWAHHVFGHAMTTLTVAPARDGDDERGRPTEPVYADEVAVAYSGTLNRQTQEVVADGYSAYYGLYNFIVEDERGRAVTLLDLGALDEAAQDIVLLNCFIVAIAGFMFVRAPQVVDETTAYALTHPPQALRLRLLLESAKLWATAYRPMLTDQISPARFRPIMNAIAVATWGMNGGNDWTAQIAFLVSDAGERYAAALIDSRNAAVRAMGT